MNYRDEVRRTANQENTELKDQLSMGAMGLSGETGEVTDLIKKSVYHGKPLDREKIIKELGDCMWYLEYLMMAVDVSREEVERVNVAKLRARYPEGFSVQAANERKDEKTNTQIS